MLSMRIVLFALVLAGGPSGRALAVQTEAPVPQTRVPVAAESVAKGLENPWGLAFLPDGRMLVTERPGRLRIVAMDGSLSSPVAGVPKVVQRGQAGLLDVALDPGFRDNGLIYLSFSEPRDGGKNSTSVFKGRLVTEGDAGRLADGHVIFRQQPAWSSSAHFGSRIVFARDGSMFVTTGDRYVAKDEAQDPSSHIGKVLRLNADGSAYAGNPKKPGWAPEVWSIGHRNVQAATLHPQTGQLWTVEHGARGGDEINRPVAGKNYGWPIITYGRDYSGAKIGIGTRRAGLEQPVYYWDPSIAPSGATFYTADRVPQWKGSLFVGALAGSHIARLIIGEGGEVVAEEKLLEGRGDRFRAVVQGPDGYLYALTDEARGQVLRVRPRE